MLLRLVLLASFLSIFPTFADDGYSMHTFRVGGGRNVQLGSGHIQNQSNDGLAVRAQYINAVNEHWGIGVEYAFLDTNDSLIDNKLWSGLGQYIFNPGSLFSFFAQAGLGIAQVQDIVGVQNSDFTTFQFWAGAGLDINFNETWAFTLMAAYHQLARDEEQNSEQSSFVPTASVTYRFGDSIQKAKVDEEIVGWSLDDDQDGVTNQQDACPNTPRGTVVDRFGCAELIGNADEDGDGVFDDKDFCPGTAAGVQVNELGCEALADVSLDSDGDGVPDNRDLCPNSRPGARVNRLGCEFREEMGLRLNVHFETAKALIKRKFLGKLDSLGKFLQTYPAVNVILEGHTDSRGKRSYNRQLSQRRADAVKRYMVDNWGIRSSRLQTRGYGEDRPIGSNKTKRGRALNRRTVAKFNISF